MGKMSEKFDKMEKVVKQIPTAFSTIAKDMDDVEDKIDENKRNINRERLFKEMSGSRIEFEMKRFYEKIMEDNPRLVEDIKELKLDNYMIGKHKIFKEELKEMNKLKENLIEIEECFINAMEIKNLFNENGGDIKFNIRKLQNAAKIAKSILKLSEKNR